MEKKEAMKILKDFHDKSALFSVRTALDVIIPELKGNEDEDIKKAILELVRQSSEVLDKQNQNNMIAWLEKQGKETNWKPSKEEMDVLYGLAYITNQYDERKEEVITRLYQDLKREFFNGSSYENMFLTNTSIEDDVRRRSTIQVLEYARSLDAYNQFGKADIDKNIAWLEKQGDNNNEDADILQRFSFYSYKDEPNVLYLSNVFVNEEYRNKGIGTKILEVADEVAMSMGYHIIRLKTQKDTDADRLYRKNGYNFLTNEGNQVWLEKQGYTKKDVDDAYLKGICDAKHELEKQGEQESADKHEPKFKNGQWIVWQNKCYKVNYNGCGYGLIDQNGLSTSLEYGTIDESAHLWTIQDAKDGDVLATDDGNIFVFDGTVEDGKYPFAYYGLTRRRFESYDRRLPFTHNNVHPATKEQRDLLFQKMKEAGYEWDAEKKELKKIEKKSQRMVSAEAKEALYDKPTDEEMKELLRTEYEKGKADAIAETQKEWSEDDEKRLQSCINILKAKSLMGKVDTANTMWLKSLKQRIGG